MTDTTLDRIASVPAARTDDDVLDLVRALVGDPTTRQCWVVFLDRNAAPIPLVMPVADLPYQPDEHVEDFAALVADIERQVGATDVVLAWERPGAHQLHPVDWEWVDACACVFAVHHVRLRAQVVVHAGGAALVELEDHEPAVAS